MRQKLSKSPELIAVGRMLRNDENFCIFFHRGHNYTHDRIKKG